MNDTSYLIWLDLEMTGLVPETDHILEIATLITDNQLKIVAEGPNIAIHQEEAILQNMHPWSAAQHQKSGLIDRVRKSAVTLEEAEEKTLAFLSTYVSPQGSPLCGNTIYQDRRFLCRYMPKLEAYFHYRLIDVSTLKELAKRWAPKVYRAVEKESKHLALDDIKESVMELRYYHDHWLTHS